MSIQLHNKNIRLVIETAGEKYTGSRFDWNGTVMQIYYQSLPILSQEKLPFHRNPRIYGRGLHNEFGIKNCIGYDEVPVGGLFPKIGTGWLVKDEKPYFFYTQYKLNRLNFSYKKESDTKVIFTCVSGEQNGYSYTYTKTIELNDDSFAITYNLSNTGSKKIATTEYVHNFLNPGHQGTGSHLSLKFPWSFSPAKLAENVKTDGVIQFDKNTINMISKPDHEFFIGGAWQARENSNDEQYKTLKGQWILTDTKSKIRISENDSFVPWGTDVWGHRADISPELFIYIDIAPGKTESWTRLYHFESF